MCGRVIVSSTDVAIAARSLEAYLGPHPSAGKPGKPLKATITDLNGVFCFMLSPGEYFVKVHLFPLQCFSFLWLKSLKN